jgi:dephospho-CoA kinase
VDVIGLTGGIAAGKSAVAARLAELGAVIIDADQLARDVVRPGSRALAAIAHRFGAEVLAADGTLDRARLADIVFADAEARAELNAIVHPAVRQRYDEVVAEAFARDSNAIVVYDVPLLAEARAASEFSSVIVVDAPADVRLQRLVNLRGMEPEAARARISAQMSDADRLALADTVIDASGTLEHTREQVDSLWSTLVAQRAVGRRS